MSQNKNNLSDLCEQTTSGERAKQQEVWLINNQSAIESYNEDVAKNATFSDGLRSF